jgi:hypothetical protein
MRIAKWILVLLALNVLPCNSSLHAQGNCPPGYYQVGDPNQGSSGCAPLPGGAQGSVATPLPPRWADAWGAIASYISKGVIGSSTDLPTRSQAKQAALQDCRAKGGLDCKVEISYANQCAALVVSHASYGVFLEQTLDGVVKKSMTTCSSGGDTTCRVMYSVCSLPHRIQ